MLYSSINTSVNEILYLGGDTILWSQSLYLDLSLLG